MPKLAFFVWTFFAIVNAAAAASSIYFSITTFNFLLLLLGLVNWFVAIQSTFNAMEEYN